MCNHAFPPRYGIKDKRTGEWLAHYSYASQWQCNRNVRAVFTIKDRALQVRDCWRYRGRKAVLVRLRYDWGAPLYGQ